VPFVNKSALEKLIALWEAEIKDHKRTGQVRQVEMLERVIMQVKEAMSRHPASDYIFQQEFPLPHFPLTRKKNDLSSESHTPAGAQTRRSH
jgi:hypothetical protein